MSKYFWISLSLFFSVVGVLGTVYFIYIGDIAFTLVATLIMNQGLFLGWLNETIEVWQRREGGSQ